MLAIIFALALDAAPNMQPPPAPFVLGRLYTTKGLHVGVRPHFYADGAETAVAATLQVTVKTKYW